MKLALVRSFLFAALAACALVALPTGLAAQQWKTYSFPADNFTISFPAEPDPATKELDSPNGKVEVRSWATEDGQTALVIGVFAYQKGLKGRDPRAVLEAGKQGLLTSSNARASAESEIALGTAPGLAFTAESATALMTVRMYLAGDNIYQLIVFAPDKQPYARTQQFFDSFALTALGLK